LILPIDLTPETIRGFFRYSGDMGRAVELVFSIRTIWSVEVLKSKMGGELR